MDALLIFLCLFSFSAAQSEPCSFTGKSGKVYDLPLFDATEPKIQNQQYIFEVSLCSELTCGVTKGSGVCQSKGTDNWNCGKLSSRKIEESANGLFIRFTGGDSVPPERSSTVVLECAETTALTNVFEDNHIYYLYGRSPAACGTKPVCTFTGESGVVYDLSLFDTEVSVVDRQGYTYKFNPCGIDCGGNEAGVCQINDKETGHWSCGELSKMEMEESENGLIFRFTEGDDNRSSTVFLTCDETTALTNVFEEPQYRYTLIGRSPAACLPKDPNSDSDSSSSSSSDKGSPNEMNTKKDSDGLTGGQTVAIVLSSCFFLIIVLLVLFVVFMKRRNKGNGDEVQMKVNHTVEHRKDKKANKSSESGNEH